MSKPACGWREWVALPELGVDAVKAKIDTGARTSALHASHIREYNEAGAPWVRFCLHPNQRSQAGAIWCDAPIADRRDVRNSGGKAEPRYVIETELRIGSAAWNIELTLTSRANMGFRMLLGRTAVRGRYLVDAGRSYLIGPKPGSARAQKP